MTTQVPLAADDLRSLVIELALLIDGSLAGAEDWYETVPINELGGYTAADLVGLGEGQKLLLFLLRVATTPSR